jgi:uncharacterized coiled-coil protein SlyX
MAKKAVKPNKREDAERSPEMASKQELLIKVHERYKVMTEADRENRAAMIADMKFVHVPGEQWDPALKRRRGARPCFEINKTATTIKRVINDMRANRPMGKVRAVEDNDKDTAEVFEGLIRNIWNNSDGDSVIDYAAEFQVAGGMGAWRVETKYSDDTSFDQDVCITTIRNPLCLYADPAASDMLKRDAADWIYTDQISKAAFESRWPKAERTSFEASEFDDDSWLDDDETVRICEYWYRKPVIKEIGLLSDGSSVDLSKELPEGAEVVRKRKVRTTCIHMCIVSGDSVLEEAEWAGSKFPWIQVYGSWLVIDGKVHWYGLTRNGKDAARMYNVSRTAAAESIASGSQAKFWSTLKQAEGHMDMWRRSVEENIPALLFNPDPANPGPPQAMPGVNVPVAFIQDAQIASEDMKSAFGIFDQSLGAGPTAQSGRAIAARQRQAEIATFNFSDNMAKGIRLTWEILIDLVPKIYTAEKSVRVLGADGAEKYVKINSMKMDPKTANMVPVNDISRGKFDTTITVGPSFATKRMESTDALTQLAQSYPPLMQVAGDIVMRNMDLAGSEQIADRLQTMLPPNIQQQISGDKPLPPEVQAAMQKADMVMQQAQAAMQQAQQVGAEATATKAEAEKAIADLKVAAANLKASEAQFKAHIATTQAEAATSNASVSAGEGQQLIEGVGAQIAETVTAVNELQEVIEQLATRLMQSEATIAAKAAEPPPVVAQPVMPPRLKAIRSMRDALGNLVAIPEYEDEVMQ